MRSSSHGFIAAGDFREVLGKSLGGDSARPGLSTSRLLQSIDSGLERGDIIGVRRWFPVGIRPQHGIEHSSELADGGKLGLLVIGNETLDGFYTGDLRQLGELFHIGLGGLLARCQHINGTRPDGRIASQLQKRRNRFDFGASQIERIEVELQPIQQRQTGRDHEPGTDNDRDAVPFHEPINGR